MKDLLEKTRRMNRLLQKSAGAAVDFNEMAKVLSEIIDANVYVVSRKGKVLGHALARDYKCESMERTLVESGFFPGDYNEKLLSIAETTVGFQRDKDCCVFNENESCNYVDRITTIVPINGGGERLGTLIVAKFGEEFTDQDLLLAEYGATVVGMEILRSKGDEIEEDARKKAVVQMAIGTLSYSELEAIQHIFEELNGNEGLLVASKIADRVGITRSVIVNALRKFESAGVVESRSLGMKGTYIKVLNDKLLEELKKLR